MSRRKKRRQEVQSVAVTESKVAELRARQALLAEENAAKKLKFIEDELRADDARRHIYEGFGFGGVSINGQTFVDRRDYMDLQFGLGNRYVLGSSTGFHQTTIQDRHLGRDEPWTVTQDDIAAARGMARLVTTINCPAVGIIENLENYTLKRGCNYVAGEKKNSKPPEGLIAAVQDCVDEFLDDNSWHCNRDREALTRSHVDGEVFMGLYPQKNGFTKVRFIEPDQVVQPGMPPFTDLEVYQRWNVVVKHASNWEFGVHTPDHDVEHVYGYCLQWDPSGPYDYMPAEHVVHFKRNVPANVKRGRTDFYPAWEWLLDEARLLRNTTSGAARLAAIAYIIQYATASKSEVEGMRRSNSDYEINLKSSSGTSKTLYREYEIPGERLEVPEGQEYQAGPMGAERGQAFLEVCNGILRNVAVRFCMTEGMVSGDDSSNNRASMAEAGSRFYNYIEGNQGRIGSFYESVIWKALLFAFRAGRFARFGFAPGGQRGWSDFKRVVQVAIEFPDIDPKQDLERTQKRQLLNGMRAMSIKTIQIQEKLDPEEEAANFKEEMEQQMAQQQAMQGGMGGGLAGMLGGRMPPGGAPGQGGMGSPAPPFGGPTDAAPPSPTAPSASAPEPDPNAQPDALGESRVVSESQADRNAGWWEFVICTNEADRDAGELGDIPETELARLRRAWEAMSSEARYRWDMGASPQARRIVAEEWLPYKGPKGGEGWKWNGQGKPVYQTEKPRDRRDGGVVTTNEPTATKPAPAPRPPAEMTPEQRAAQYYRTGAYATPSSAPQATEPPAAQEPSLRGTQAIKEAVAKWTPDQRKADWKQHGVKGASFKAWFGDWEHDRDNASKVVKTETGEPQETAASPAGMSRAVDAQGNPITLYHGTASGGYDQFDNSKIAEYGNLFGPGHYFTDDLGIAQEYSRKTGTFANVPASHIEAIVIPPEQRAAYLKDYLALIASDTGRNEEYRTKVLAGLKVPGAVEAFQQTGRIVDLEAAHCRAHLGRDWVKPDEKGNYGLTFFENSMPLGDKYGYQVNPGAEIKKVYLNVRNPKDYDELARPEDVQRLIEWAAATKRYPGSNNPETLDFYFKHLFDKFDDAKVLRRAGIKSDNVPATWENVQRFAKSLREVKPDLFAGTKPGEITWQAAVYILTDGAESPTRVKAVNDYWRQQGHDGIKHTGGWNIGKQSHKVWIAFEPTQIKATDNQGTFDETNPKLRESVQILHQGQVLFSGPEDQAVQILETGFAEYGAAAVQGIVIETASGQRALGESWLVESEEPDQEGRWVTLKNGRRVFIAPDGMITKGLGTGQHVWNFGKQGPATVERGKHEPVTIEPTRTEGQHTASTPEHPVKRLTGKVKDAARRFERWLVGWFKSEDPTARRLLKRRAARAIRANAGLTQISQAKRSVVRDMTRDFVDWVKAQYHDERDIDDVDRLLKARITSIAGESEAQRWEAAELVFEASSEAVRLAVLEGTAQAIREHHQARG